MECQLPVCQWELLQFNLRVYLYTSMVLHISISLRTCYTVSFKPI